MPKGLGTCPLEEQTRLTLPPAGEADPRSSPWNPRGP